jgi:hypothetical protein
MFAYVEEGRLIRIQDTPMDLDLGDSLANASVQTLRSFGWYPVIIDKADIGPGQTRSDDIIVVDGDVVRVVQTVRNLSDEEAFEKSKNSILSMIESIEAAQTDRAERELLLEVAEHLDLTQSVSYNKLRKIEDNIADKRRLLAQLNQTSD